MDTTDIGLASYVYSLGNDVQIKHINFGHCEFQFNDCPEIRDWQSGSATVNALTFITAYRTLLRKVKELK